jgi:CheY-like chemotaxis protein
MAKVLLVEDDNNLREIYQARLMAEGYDIVAAQNGEEALVVAKQNKPDLIISDVMMPRISGFEMLDILRNTEGLKHTPVIMLTALGQSEDQKRADNLGADKYLVKSQVTLEDIVGAAKELLDKDGMSGIADVPPAPAEPAAAPEPAQPAVETTTGAIPVAEPPVDAEPAAVTEPTPAPAPSEPVVPASVVPQPNTTVVVPPAPANPTPPTVTTVPLPEPPAPVEPTAPVAPTLPESPVVEAPVAPTEPTPAPDPALESKAEAAVTDAATQTLEAEEKALQEQIASYANEPAVAPAAVDPTQAAEAATDVSNDAAIEEAVAELNEATPEPSAPAVPPSVANAPEPEAAPAPVEPAPAPEPAPVAPVPAPTPAVSTLSTSDNVSVAGKKVIKPLNDLTAAPKLDELLAKEEARQPTPPPAPVVDGAPKPPQPGPSFDPNTAL